MRGQRRGETGGSWSRRQYPQRADRPHPDRFVLRQSTATQHRISAGAAMHAALHPSACVCTSAAWLCLSVYCSSVIVSSLSLSMRRPLHASLSPCLSRLLLPSPSLCALDRPMFLSKSLSLPRSRSPTVCPSGCLPINLSSPCLILRLHAPAPPSRLRESGSRHQQPGLDNKPFANNSQSTGCAALSGPITSSSSSSSSTSTSSDRVGPPDPGGKCFNLNAERGQRMHSIGLGHPRLPTSASRPKQSRGQTAVQAMRTGGLRCPSSPPPAPPPSWPAATRWRIRARCLESRSKVKGQ